MKAASKGSGYGPVALWEDDVLTALDDFRLAPGAGTAQAALSVLQDVCESWPDWKRRRLLAAIDVDQVAAALEVIRLNIARAPQLGTLRDELIALQDDDQPPPRAA